MALKEIIKERIKKLANIKKRNILPYPAFFKRPTKIKDAILKFKKNKKIILAGRIFSIRVHGGSTFLDFKDGTGKFQAFLRKDKLSDDYDFFLENVDIGDFLLFEGKLFLTKKGEKTIEVEKFKILCKSLRPLPEKWHGLSDNEERFRKRYLDLLMNPEVKERFLQRSKIIYAIREFLEREEFLEVETPILQPIYGGASAEPFKTHHRALDIDLYLRIAPELYLKRLLVGGFDKVYEIGRVFRNEGIDKYHNPDFTTLEFYWAYATFDDLMRITEGLVKYVVKKVFKKQRIHYHGKEIDFSKPFKKIEFYSFLDRELGINTKSASDREIINIAKKFDIPTKNKSRFKILDDIFKKISREKINQPTFVLYTPIELTPLAKKSEKDNSLALRLQLIIGGWEVVNAFSELNDPIEQKKRFKEQLAERKKGDKEAHPFDKDFIEALEYGMPPAVGFGMGIDRLVAVLTNADNLREVILFPLMKPKK